MSTLRPLSDSFQPEELERLQIAFDATWAALKAQRAFSGYTSDDDLRRVLSEKLCSFAASGIKDAEQLRSIMLVSLQPRHPSSLSSAADEPSSRPTRPNRTLSSPKSC
jgi:hypothetical protein